MYSNLGVIAAGCLICLAVFFLTFTGTNREPADYVWNNGTEPQTLDPTLASGQPEGAIAINVFEGLTVYHPKTLEAVPALAESWEVDGLTYVFHLREDAWWVKGDHIFEVAGKKRNVTAHDVIYTWQRHLAPETGSEYSFILHVVSGITEYEEAITEHWLNVVARYEEERPEVSASSLPALDPGDREAVTRFRAEKFRELVGMRAVDDTTLEIQLKSPTPYFLYITSFYPLFIVPREPIEELGEAWVRPENIVSNGPYVLEEWKFNSHVRLRKNPHYWETRRYAEKQITAHSKKQIDGTARDFELRELELFKEFGAFETNGLEILDALAVEELTTSLNLYLNGDTDFVRQIAPEVRGDLVSYVQAGNRLPDLHHGTAQIVYYYVVNLNLPVFRDNRDLGRLLRRALALAIDRKTIVKVVTRGFQEPAYRLVPKGMPRYDTRSLFGSGSYEKDLNEAKRLVGKVRDSGITIPTLTLLYNTNESHAKIAAFIQSIWRDALGLEVELANQEWGVYLDSKRTGQFDVARAGWIADYPDPNTFLDMFTSRNQNNDPNYSNPVYDRILLKYGAEILEALETPESRQALIEDIEGWQAYGEIAGREEFVDGKTLALSLREAVEAYGDAPESQRLEQAFAIRLLLFQVADRMLAHDMPVLPIYSYTLTELWPPELRGMYFNTRDTHPRKYLRWEGGKRPTGSRYHKFPRFSTRPTEAATARR